LAIFTDLLYVISYFKLYSVNIIIYNYNL
jgi:hypothetical protein